jgi:hypothetical protein
MKTCRGVAQLVAHSLWERGVVSSSLATPTIKKESLMINPLFLYIFCFFTALNSSERVANSLNYDVPLQWAEETVTVLDSADLQICINTLYLLYANNLIEHKLHQIKTPLQRLTHSIRTQMNDASLDNNMQSIDDLKKLLTKLSILVGTRKIYNRMLESCMDYFNDKSPESPLSMQLLHFKTEGNNLLNSAFEAQYPEVIKYHELSVKKLMDHSLSLQDITRFHLHVSHESELKRALSGAPKSDYPHIVLVEEITRNSDIAVNNAGLLLNELDDSYDFIAQLVNTTQDIYYAYYKALYTQIAQAGRLSQEAVALFGMCGTLPEECISQLPAPDNVFEYALQMAKSYTHTEVTQ